jgi:hypothetical protein
MQKKVDRLCGQSFWLLNGDVLYFELNLYMLCRRK